VLYNDQVVIQTTTSLGPWIKMGAPSKGKGVGKDAGLSDKNGML